MNCSISDKIMILSIKSKNYLERKLCPYEQATPDSKSYTFETTCPPSIAIPYITLAIGQHDPSNSRQVTHTITAPYSLVH